MFEQILAYAAGFIGLIGIWLAMNKVRGAIFISFAVQVIWFVFGWVAGYPAFMITAIVYAAIYARRLVLDHADRRERPFAFTKLPVQIEAVQLLDIDNVDMNMELGTRGHGTINEAPLWFKDALRSDFMYVQEDKEHATFVLIIETKEGPMRASIGDWIIRGIKGELYPCKPDIFDKSYA